jgi:predicted regulator of amino acid metabolism with ACT domain
MDHLDEISVEELHDALDNVEGKKPPQRLLAAIAYKNGITQTELAEWHNTGRRTIYSWLKRLDTDESLEQAVTDAHRSGRKRKLSQKEQQEFEETVHESPKEVEVDAPAGRRRSSSSISTRPTMSSTQFRAVGGCSKKRD